jgi:hypothetical protein
MVGGEWNFLLLLVSLWLWGLDPNRRVVLSSPCNRGLGGSECWFVLFPEPRLYFLEQFCCPGSVRTVSWKVLAKGHC